MARRRRSVLSLVFAAVMLAGPSGLAAQEATPGAGPESGEPPMVSFVATSLLNPRGFTW